MQGISLELSFTERGETILEYCNIFSATYFFLNKMQFAIIHLYF